MKYSTFMIIKVLIVSLLFSSNSFADVLANKVADHTIISKYSALDVSLEDAAIELNKIFKKERLPNTVADEFEVKVAKSIKGVKVYCAIKGVSLKLILEVLSQQNNFEVVYMKNGILLKPFDTDKFE